METPFFLAILVGEHLNRPSEKKPRSGKAPGPESPAEAAFVCTFVTAVQHCSAVHAIAQCTVYICTLTVCASEILHSQRRCDIHHTVQSQPGATEMQILGPPPVLKSCSGPPAADFGFGPPKGV